MLLDGHLAQVQAQLVAAAALGDDRTRTIAGALTTAAVPTVRLALLAAVSELADEVTAALLDYPGSPAVTVRIDGDEVAVDVRAAEPAGGTGPNRHADGEASARISLRLTDPFKADIDAAADRDGVSVNTWLARAAADALREGAVGGRPSGRSRSRAVDHHQISGWING